MLRMAIHIVGLIGAFLSSLLPVASSPGDALSQIADTQSSDPGGFTLMVICISLLVVAATTLMVVTLTYSFKSKTEEKSNGKKKDEVLSDTKSCE